MKRLAILNVLFAVPWTSAHADIKVLGRANCLGLINESVTYDRPQSLSGYSDTPAIDKETVEVARREDIDLAKATFTPGVHRVSLAESWFVGSRLDVIRQQIAEQAGKGFHRAPDEEVPSLSRALASAPLVATELDRILDKRYASIADVRPKLRNEPIDISGTQLEAARFLEAGTAGGWENGKWTGIARYFDVPGVGLMMLQEIDFAASRASITLINELVNADVNGAPAIAKTARTPTGRTLVSVGWMTDRMSYSLMWEPVRPDRIRENQEELIQLARGLGR